LEILCEDAADKIDKRGVAMVTAILQSILPLTKNPNTYMYELVFNYSFKCCLGSNTIVYGYFISKL
jgi:hypothetical protein